MNPFFSTKERVFGLRVQAISWVGTPFSPNGNTKGKRGGVSCQKLASAIYEATWKRIEVPEVSMAHSRFSRDSILEPWVDARDDFAKVEDQKAGDLLGFEIGGTVHHCGVLITDREFIHSMTGVGVMVSTLLDGTWLSRLRRIWRPIE